MFSNALMESNRVLQGAIYNKEVEIHKKKFEIFITLQKDEKIGKYKNGEYYIVQPGYTQQLWRWYYNENRSKTLKYLDEDFTKFAQLLDKICLSNTYINTNISYTNICLKVIVFVDKIMPGLYNLKQTYLDTVGLVSKIDSIILILLDFKEKIRKEKRKKKSKEKGTLVHSFDDLDLNYLSTIV
jgi:hypothetical protein